MENNPQIKQKDIYLLGGKDLEMYQIKKKLSRNGEDFLDRDLVWGAKIDDYADEIEEILGAGSTPVAVELAGAETAKGVVDIDHHGNKSGRPSSLTQVMSRIDKPMTFVDRLIAANDSGYIPGMERLIDDSREKFVQLYGEERFEKLKSKIIGLIRAKDRQMQGVTQEDEKIAEEALKRVETTHTGTRVARIPGDKWSPVRDRLYQEDQSDAIIVCDTDKEKQQVYFFGRGDVCKSLKENFASGISWGGGEGFGNKEGQGFAGAIVDNPQEVIDFVTTQQQKNDQL